MEKLNPNAVNTLKEMAAINAPVGAIYLGEKTSIPQATVGRILFQLEGLNFVEKVGNKGRMVTQSGHEYLRNHEIQTSRIQSVNHLANLYSGEISKEKLLEVLEVRMLLEVNTAERACIHANDMDRMALEKCMLEWKLALHEGTLGSDQDLKLHLLIAKMSGNATLFSMCKLLLTEDNVYAGFSAKAARLSTIQTEQHEAIVQAIIANDGEKAKEAMYLHLKTIYEDVKKSAW